MANAALTGLLYSGVTFSVNETDHRPDILEMIVGITTPSRWYQEL
jgi:hypothetical protein